MKKHFFLLILMFLAYVGFFTFVSCLKFDSFSYKDFDLTILLQVLGNIINYRFFPVSVGDFVLFSGGHIPLIACLLAPLYAVFPGPYILLFIQSLFLGAGVFGIYLIAKEILDSKSALCFSFIYLIYPALNYINLFEVHEVAFSIPFLLFMYYFFLKRHFGFFVSFMFLALLCREDIPLVIVGFGLYVLLLKLRWQKALSLKWVLAPVFCGMFWLISALSLNSYVQRSSYLFSDIKGAGSIGCGWLGLYRWLGNNPLEIFITIFTRPVFVLKNILSPHKALYLFELLLPLGFLPFLSLPTFIIVLCGMSESLLSLRPLFSSVYFHYSSMVIPFIFISAFCGVRKIRDNKIFKINPGVIIAILLCLAVFSGFFIGPFGSLFAEISYMRSLKDSDYTALRNFFIKQLPERKPVITTFELSSHLAPRDLIYFFYFFTYNELSYSLSQLKQNYDYALIDFDDSLTFHSSLYNKKEGLKSRCFILQDGWMLVETLDTLAIFKKGQRSDYKFAETEMFLKEEEILKYSDKNLKPVVLGYKYTREKIGDFSALDFECSILKAGEAKENYLPVVLIYNQKGEVLKNPLIIPFRLYPFAEWKQGEVVKLKSKLLLPKGFREEITRVGISLILIREGSIPAAK